MQHDEDGRRTIRALEHTITKIWTTLNNGLKTMVNDQKIELAIVKSDIQLMLPETLKPWQEDNDLPSITKS